MAIYVDQSIPWPKTDVWPYDTVCHLLADEPQELVDFARKIGLRLEWLQSGNFLHYDLTPSKRKKAVRMGAIPLEGKALLAKFQEMRVKQVQKIVAKANVPSELIRKQNEGTASHS